MSTGKQKPSLRVTKSRRANVRMTMAIAGAASGKMIDVHRLSSVAHDADKRGTSIRRKLDVLLLRLMQERSDFVHGIEDFAHGVDRVSESFGHELFTVIGVVAGRGLDKIVPGFLYWIHVFTSPLAVLEILVILPYLLSGRRQKGAGEMGQDVVSMAFWRASAGSSPTSSHRSQNSSRVGVPPVSANSAPMRGCVTPIACATARCDGRSGMVSHASLIVFIASLSRSVHVRAFSAIGVIVQMERNISKEKSRQLDEVERYVTILSMETNVTTMTVAQTAIEMLDRLSAAKGTGRAQLAERLGVSRQTVTSRFRNKGMSLEDFVNTAKALDADPAKVLGQAQRINRNTNNKQNLAA